MRWGIRCGIICGIICGNLGSFAFAADASSLEKVPKNDLSWWAADEKQVQKAVCRRKLPVLRRDIEKFYNSLPPVAEQVETQSEVRGFRFQNERPELVEAFSKLLNSGEFEPHLFDGVAKAVLEKAPDHLQDRFQFPPSCSKVLCASEGVFGKEVGPQMVFLMERFALNTSPYSFKYASLFKPDEIADVIRSLELVDPDVFIFKRRGQKLIRFMRGYTRGMYANGTTYANASIELYDSWEEQSSAGRQYTLFHEFSHHASRGMSQSLHETPEWLKLSGWNIAENEDEASGVELTNPESLVSQYASADASEDFAESVVAYRLNPALLKAKSLEKYHFIKRIVYNGREFDREFDHEFESEQKCDDSKSLLKDYQSKINADRFPFSAREKQEIRRACQMEFFRIFLGRGSLGHFHQCINYESTWKWLQKANREWPHLHPEFVFNKELKLSHLQFPVLVAELTPALQREFVEWLLKAVRDPSVPAGAFEKAELSCGRWWNQNFVEIFQEKSSPGLWSQRFFQAGSASSASKEAVRALCRDLQSEAGPVLTRPVVLKYVSRRTSPRK